MNHPFRLLTFSTRTFGLAIFSLLFHTAIYSEGSPSKMQNSSEALTEAERAERFFPGLQVPGEDPFIPSKDPAERKKQLEQNGVDLKTSREKAKAINETVKDDQALKDVSAKTDAFSQSLADEAKRTNGRAGLPKDFYEKRDALIKEYDEALKAALGPDTYKDYIAEKNKQQVLMRRSLTLRKKPKQ